MSINTFPYKHSKEKGIISILQKIDTINQEHCLSEEPTKPCVPRFIGKF